MDLLDRLNRTASQLPRWFRPWLEFEREAEALRMWEPLMVPGLLQTEDYARAILSRSPGVTAEQAEENVIARMDRQGILRDRHLRCSGSSWTKAFSTGPSPAEVMKGQFERLLEAGESRSISIQVLLYTACSVVGLLGGFVVAGMPRNAPPWPTSIPRARGIG